MEKTEAQKAKQRAATARHRAKQKAMGIKRVLTDKEREDQRLYVARRRAEAKAAQTLLPADTWHLRNPDKHRQRVQRYRSIHVERMREIGRIAQLERRSTPWGKINNCLVAVLHRGVRAASATIGKYNGPLGYSWADLRAHLESQFTPAMNWKNWGSVWELDHIKPLSSFQYETLDDPLFRECWALTNLRPLLREENASKGAKHI